MTNLKNDTEEVRSTGRRKVVEWVALSLIVAVLLIMIFLSIESRVDTQEESRVDETALQEESVNGTTDEVAEVATAPLYEEYDGLDESTVFTRVTDEEALDTMRDGTGVVFLGFASCPWCQGLAPVVDQAAKNAGLSEVQYVDIRESRESSNNTYLEMRSILEEYLDVDESGEPMIYVPDMTIFVDGEVVYRYESEEVVASESAPNTYWTEDRTNRVITQLEAEFRQLVQN